MACRLCDSNEKVLYKTLVITSEPSPLHSSVIRLLYLQVLDQLSARRLGRRRAALAVLKEIVQMLVLRDTKATLNPQCRDL